MRYPSGKSHLWAILAHPVAHVRAPEFMNPMIEAAGRDAFLVPFHVLPEDLEATMRSLAAIQNLKGFIVTIPHKPAMARLCAELGPNGKLTGTVNTVRIEAGGRLVGEMFDGLGLVGGVRAAGMGPEGRRVLLVGAGGAGRAIAMAVAAEKPARLTIANRTAAKAEELVGMVRSAFPGVEAATGPAAAAGHDLVINATSLGLKPGEPMPVDPLGFGPGVDLFDIIAARDTELMAAAAAKGARVVGGRPMIEHQARAQIAFLDPPHLPS
jgi:shikimate dehydrogenase